MFGFIMKLPTRWQGYLGAAIVTWMALTVPSAHAQPTAPPKATTAAPVAPPPKGPPNGGALLLDRIVRPVQVENPAERTRMEAHLKSRYDKSDVKHDFKLPSGDDVDCVDIAKQPGMRRVEMVGRKVETPPTRSPRPPLGAAGQDTPLAGNQDGFLTGGKDDAGHDRRCPAATVPIRRVTIEEVSAFKNLKEFERKRPSHLGRQSPLSSSPDVAPTIYGPNDSHQYAHAYRNVTNYGSHAALNIWNPKVMAGIWEFSLSQLWIARGTGSGLETLEVGVQVMPLKYGNSNARLFIYSTSDGYASNSYNSGCYNLDCGRFIQTSGGFVIGAPFANYSTTGGTQREVQVSFQHFPSGWWLAINDQWIGYYPLNLFDAAGVKNYASNIDFGGEIIDDRTQHSYHTSTDMGSSTGAYPAAGYRAAAYQRQLWYFDADGTAKHATGLTTQRNSAYCYDISAVTSSSNDWGTYFYFGGPGYNMNCR